jgi:hypothetical protein
MRIRPGPESLRPPQHWNKMLQNVKHYFHLERTKVQSFFQCCGSGMFICYQLPGEEVFPASGFSRNREDPSHLPWNRENWSEIIFISQTWPFRRIQQFAFTYRISDSRQIRKKNQNSFEHTANHNIVDPNPEGSGINIRIRTLVE